MDQQLQDLINKLDNMTTALKSLTESKTNGGTGGSSGADKIVQALAKLAVQLDGTAKTYKEQRRAAQEFTKQVDKASDSYVKHTKAVDEATKKTEQTVKTNSEITLDRIKAYKDEQLQRNKLFQEMQSLGGASGLLKDKITDF